MRVETGNNISLGELLTERLNNITTWENVKIEGQNKDDNFAYLGETQIVFYKNSRATVILLKDLFFDSELEELLKEDCNNGRNREEIIECVLNNLGYQTWDFPQEIHGELARIRSFRDEKYITEIATREGVKNAGIKLGVQ